MRNLVAGNSIQHVHEIIFRNDNQSHLSNKDQKMQMKKPVHLLQRIRQDEAKNKQNKVNRDARMGDSELTPITRPATSNQNEY